MFGVHKLRRASRRDKRRHRQRLPEERHVTILRIERQIGIRLCGSIRTTRDSDLDIYFPGSKEEVCCCSVQRGVKRFLANHHRAGRVVAILHEIRRETQPSRSRDGECQLRFLALLGGHHATERADCIKVPRVGLTGLDGHAARLGERGSVFSKRHRAIAVHHRYRRRAVLNRRLRVASKRRQLHGKRFRRKVGVRRAHCDDTQLLVVRISVVPPDLLLVDDDILLALVLLCRHRGLHGDHAVGSTRARYPQNRIVSGGDRQSWLRRIGERLSLLATRRELKRAGSDLRGIRDCYGHFSGGQEWTVLLGRIKVTVVNSIDPNGE